MNSTSWWPKYSWMPTIGVAHVGSAATPGLHSIPKSYGRRYRTVEVPYIASHRRERRLGTVSKVAEGSTLAAACK